MLADMEGPSGLWWLTFLTPDLVLLTIGALAVVLLAAVVVGVVAYRRLRRDSRVLPLLLLWRLETAPPGPRRDALRLRLRLQRALLRSRRAVAASTGGGRVAGDLAGLLERTERAAAAIDRDLAVGPPDERGLRREWFDRASDRVDDLEAIAGRLAETASTSLDAEADMGLDDLRTDADRELAALKAGVEALDGLRRSNHPDR